MLLVTCTVCLFTTMMYMSTVCQSETRDKLLIPKKTILAEPKCDCPVATTTDKPSYTRHVVNENASRYEWKLQWKDRPHTHATCKVFSDSLLGRFNITSSVTEMEVKNEKVIEKVKYGGVYRPANCVSNQTVAIIIPYRDREHHLNILVNLLHNILQRQKVQYGIYVVEMSLPAQFNRGLLANAGFHTALSIGNYTCYIIHDVDLLPLNDRNMYTCDDASPTHLLTKSTKFPNGLPYSTYVGGVLAVTTEQYLKLNGFSNLFFGWGGEDDDFYHRMKASDMTFKRPPEHIGTFLALPHTKDASNPANPYRQALLKQSKLRKNMDGVNSALYHRKAVEFRALYTWVLVECVESEVMQNYANLRVAYLPRSREKQSNQKPLVLVKKVIKANPIRGNAVRHFVV